MASFFNLILDTIAPAGVTMVINDNAEYTTAAAVNLKIGTTDEVTDGYQMKVWGDITDATDEASAVWQTYTAEKAVTLTTGDAQKTINIKLRDDVGNESVVVTDTIILNTVVPVVTISGPDKSKISKVEGFNTAILSFTSDVDFLEYKVCVVNTSNAQQNAGIVIPLTAGSANTSGTTDEEDIFKASTPIEVTIKGADLEAASTGDGTKIVKVFVKNIAGTWSVA
jgi:hypothetical protein